MIASYLIHSIIAMTPSGTGSQNGGGGFLAFLPMILIFFIMYWLILRPQGKRQKQHKSMLETITKGDQIVTTGGIHGVVLKVNDNTATIIVKVAENVKLELDRGAVARKIVPGQEFSKA